MKPEFDAASVSPPSDLVPKARMSATALRRGSVGAYFAPGEPLAKVSRRASVADVSVVGRLADELVRCKPRPKGGGGGGKGNPDRKRWVPWC